jgi:hypothetical protein
VRTVRPAHRRRCERLSSFKNEDNNYEIFSLLPDAVYYASSVRPSPPLGLA